MWKCPKCKEELRDYDDYCWNCKTKNSSQRIELHLPKEYISEELAKDEAGADASKEKQKTKKISYGGYGMKTFKYKWSIDGNEFVGGFNCDDETQLRQHIESKGGKLIEIISQEIIDASTSKTSRGNTKKCPYCAEEIQAEAIKCKHCGESIITHKIIRHNYCPRCLKEYDNSWSVCMICEVPLMKGQANEIRQPHELGGLTIKCPRCGHAGSIDSFKKGIDYGMYCCLACIMILPALLYWIWVHDKRKCPQCGNVF